MWGCLLGRLGTESGPEIGKVQGEGPTRSPGPLSVLIVTEPPLLPPRSGQFLGAAILTSSPCDCASVVSQDCSEGLLPLAGGKGGVCDTFLLFSLGSIIFIISVMDIIMVFVWLGRSVWCR